MSENSLELAIPLCADSTAWVLLPPTGRDVPTTWPTEFSSGIRVRAVLHGQINIDFRNINIAHDTAHCELLGIGQGRGGYPSLGNGRRAGQYSIVPLCGFTLGSQLDVIGVRNSGGVGGFYVRVVFLTQNFSHQRVKHQAQRHNTESRRQ